MSDAPNWWAGARLWLRGEVAEELAFGTLAEMVGTAMSRPRHERPYLSIQIEVLATELSWTDIVRLAGHPDKPTLI